MSDIIYNNLILIVDQSTYGIYCTATSDAHANNLMLGILNSFSYPLPKLLVTKEQYLYDFNSIKEHYQLISDDNLTTLPSKFITEEWIKARKLIIKKKSWMNLWEFSVRGSSRKVNDFYGNNNLMPFLIDQINKSNPEKNLYAPGIVDWANIQSVTPEIAYTELKMKVEEYGLVHLRSQAIYEKTARKIATASANDDLEEIFEQGRREIYSNKS